MKSVPWWIYTLNVATNEEELTMRHPYTVAALSFTLWTGCSGGGSLNPFGASPSSIVKTFYMACNGGEYSKVEDTLSVDSKKLVHGELAQLGGGIKGLCDHDSEGGTISSVDITSENVRGEGATVKFDIHFKNKLTRSNQKEELIKENGSWKIAPGSPF